MDGHGNAQWISCLGENMVAPMDSLQDPTFSLQHFGKFFAGSRFHTAISSILSLPVISISFRSTDKQPSTAS